MKILKRKWPVEIHALVHFLLICVLVLFVGAKLQRVNLWGGLTATEIGLILIPTLLYAKGLRMNIVETFKLNEIRLGAGISALIYGVGAVVLAGLTASAIKSLIGASPIENIMTSKTFTTYSGLELCGAIAVFCLLPAVCEELAFRGLILSSFETVLSARRSLIYSAFLFGAFHFDPVRFLPAALMGLVYGHVTLKTKSIIPAVIAHFSANSIPILVVFFKTRP